MSTSLAQKWVVQASWVHWYTHTHTHKAIPLIYCTPIKIILCWLINLQEIRANLGCLYVFDLIKDFRGIHVCPSYHGRSLKDGWCVRVALATKALDADHLICSHAWLYSMSSCQHQLYMYVRVIYCRFHFMSSFLEPIFALINFIGMK